MSRMPTESENYQWSKPKQILSDMENPHVHYQFIESLDLNSEGYPSEVMIPIHHLSENDTDDNYEMIARTSRSLDINGEWTITNMETTEGAGNDCSHKPKSGYKWRMDDHEYGNNG